MIRAFPDTIGFVDYQRCRIHDRTDVTTVVQDHPSQPETVALAESIVIQCTDCPAPTHVVGFFFEKQKANRGTFLAQSGRYVYASRVDGERDPLMYDVSHCIPHP